MSLPPQLQNTSSKSWSVAGEVVVHLCRQERLVTVQPYQKSAVTPHEPWLAAQALLPAIPVSIIAGRCGGEHELRRFPPASRHASGLRLLSFSRWCDVDMLPR